MASVVEELGASAGGVTAAGQLDSRSGQARSFGAMTRIGIGHAIAKAGSSNRKPEAASGVYGVSIW